MWNAHGSTASVWHHWNLLFPSSWQTNDYGGCRFLWNIRPHLPYCMSNQRFCMYSVQQQHKAINMYHLKQHKNEILLQITLCLLDTVSMIKRNHTKGIPVATLSPSFSALCLFSASSVRRITLTRSPFLRSAWLGIRWLSYQATATRMARSLRSLTFSPGSRSTYVFLYIWDAVNKTKITA